MSATLVFVSKRMYTSSDSFHHLGHTIYHDHNCRFLALPPLHSAYFGVGPRCHPLTTSAPRPPLLANPNLFRNPNMVFKSTFLCIATTRSLFPMAPEWSIPRSTETESLIDSSLGGGVKYTLGGENRSNVGPSNCYFGRSYRRSHRTHKLIPMYFAFVFSSISTA